MAHDALNDFDFSNHKTVVEGNSHIGSDLLGWIDSNSRNLHVRARCKILLRVAKWRTYITTTPDNSSNSRQSSGLTGGILTDSVFECSV
jgi:hypothetical protein